MIKGVFITESQAGKLKGKSFGDGNFNPIKDKDGRWFVSEIEGCKIEGAGKPEPLYRFTSEAKLSRMFLFIQLKTTLEHDSFFELNESIFDYWLSNGGEGVKDLFELSTEKWLDVGDPSPREYALNLLN